MKRNRLRLSSTARQGARVPRTWRGNLLLGLEAVARWLGRDPRWRSPRGLGQRGEELAYWFLRSRGYTIVARNYRRPPHAGEIDLIGWEGPTLVFVEVKTRAREGEYAAERAVDEEKRTHVRALARTYRRRRAWAGAYRFDLVTVYDSGTPRPRITLHRDAFRD